MRGRFFYIDWGLIVNSGTTCRQIGHSAYSLLLHLTSHLRNVWNIENSNPMMSWLLSLLVVVDVDVVVAVVSGVNDNFDCDRPFLKLSVTLS